MATQWFCRLMGSDLGPFSAREMISLVRQRRLTPEDLIRKGAHGDWVPAYLVQGLFDAAAQAGGPETATAPTTGSGLSQRVDAKSVAKPVTEAPGPKSLSGLLSTLLLGQRGQAEAKGTTSSVPPTPERPQQAAARPTRRSGDSDPRSPETAASASQAVVAGQASPTAGQGNVGQGNVGQANVGQANVGQGNVRWEERRWFCIVGGERRGPMSFDALQRIAGSGKLKPEDRVWSNACPRWSRAHEIPDLHFH